MFTLYSADFIGNPGNCSYPHKTVVMDTDSLKEAVGHDYVCAEYKHHYRNGANFLSADCLPVDCDNDHSEDPKNRKPATRRRSHTTRSTFRKIRNGSWQGYSRTTAFPVPIPKSVTSSTA